MKLLLFFLLSLLLSFELHSQVITGKVVDSTSNDLLEYVSIGIVKTHLGTITNENGKFNLEFKNQSPKAIVRFSMIGYKAQTFSIEELSNKENVITLKQEAIQIAEVVVKAGNKFKKIGTSNSTKKREFCGWGGDRRGKGHEIGLKIDLGTSFVKLHSLHIRVYKQSYDSSLFRLHIRNIKDDLPHEELLKQNILITITKSSGWADIDLSKYNLVLKDEIALTLEWLKVLGLNENKLIRVGSEKKSANVLFSIKKKQGCTYVKWGVEAKWSKVDTKSPSIYLTIQE